MLVAICKHINLTLMSIYNKAIILQYTILDTWQTKIIATVYIAWVTIEYKISFSYKARSSYFSTGDSKASAEYYALIPSLLLPLLVPHILPSALVDLSTKFTLSLATFIIHQSLSSNVMDWAVRILGNVYQVNHMCSTDGSLCISVPTITATIKDVSIWDLQSISTANALSVFRTQTALH